MRTSILQKVESFENRTNVTFNVSGAGNDYVSFINSIHSFAKKYNAQENLFQNASHLQTDYEGNVIGEKHGNIGGTITFHAHSCDHVNVANELAKLLK